MILVDPIEVEPRDGYRIWVRYEDGVEGELDLSHLAGKGVFKAWDDHAYFEGVHINEEAGCVSWDAPPGSDTEIDIAPDTGYAQLLGITREQIAAMSDEDEFYSAVEQAQRETRVSVSA